MISLLEIKNTNSQDVNQTVYHKLERGAVIASIFPFGLIFSVFIFNAIGYSFYILSNLTKQISKN